MFDDGFQWKCTTGRLYKLKENIERGNESMSLDSSSSSSANPSPIPYGPGPSSSAANGTTIPFYHTHLFDPTRDYLGSKSERREKKRKLNIKEIFNIGQKKQRKQRSANETDSVAPRIVKQRKPRTVRKKFKMQHDTSIRIKTEIKNEIPGDHSVFL